MKRRTHRSRNGFERGPAVLDTTLRDGSYAINFKFTASDTAIISSALEQAGVKWIEIGHGVGLNASRCGKGEAAETDEAYLKAAARKLKKAKFGMLCIPGIGRLEDIRMAAEFGMGFVRIATDVSDLKKSEKFIAAARKEGMFVSANFLKSYTMDPRKFSEKALLTQKYGSDMLCIVDSAGGMLPAEVGRYVRAVRDVSDIPLGFHGHNNLGLAVANSLQAVEWGVGMIDTSLQGIGRSSGNTPTELFVMAMERMGFHLGINPFAVMDVGEKYIQPLFRRPGYHSLDIVCGYAQFHTSYMGVIREFAGKYRIDPRLLVIGLCEHDKVNAPRGLVERVAKKLRADSEEVYTARFHLDQYYGSEQDNEK